ncbi:MAG: cytosine permease, partial [Actinomycetota bacterium]
MASLADRLERLIEREAPSWGISPVPTEHRRLSGVDLSVLWGDLSVGLLVMVTGALLVPALGLPRALLAIFVGSVIGCLALALAGLAG